MKKYKELKYNVDYSEFEAALKKLDSILAEMIKTSERAHKRPLRSDLLDNYYL